MDMVFIKLYPKVNRVYISIKYTFSTNLVKLSQFLRAIAETSLSDLSCELGNIPNIFMSSLCGVGVRVRVRVNNFSSKTTRPRDVLFFLKDTLSIEDEKLFKACKSVCSSVC